MKNDRLFPRWAARAVRVLCLLTAAALLLCACQALEGLPTGAPTPTPTGDAPQDTPSVTATPDPALESSPTPSPTPTLIECNVYLSGDVLPQRAYFDPATGAEMMVPLEAFVAAAGLTMENEAARLTLRQEGGTTVVIEDIYSAQSNCTVDGELTVLTVPFTSRSGVVYAPLNLVTLWFGYEWTQNPVGDILISPAAPPEEDEMEVVG